jgi:hypothetical protein
MCQRLENLDKRIELGFCPAKKLAGLAARVMVLGWCVLKSRHANMLIAGGCSPPRCPVLVTDRTASGAAGERASFAPQRPAVLESVD